MLYTILDNYRICNCLFVGLVFLLFQWLQAHYRFQYSCDYLAYLSQGMKR